ncbi:hypothetical protein POTOM_053718 [Populus tomentosa]|uniref:Uncharacterized protein n=1 Tax=Populus tomentosa TaxID=118781 RepID=A0A8X8C7U0_POPTO|nr:hypothetical protein POTOM_053718 [Populus tomentosa]
MFSQVVDLEELHLPTIGLKKDEYLLDGKHVTFIYVLHALYFSLPVPLFLEDQSLKVIILRKTEVMNSSESGGLSCSNLYYVEHQGKVEEARSKVSEKLAKMHDAVLNAHKESKDLEKVLKDLTKEVHALSMEKEMYASVVRIFL